MAFGDCLAQPGGVREELRRVIPGPGFVEIYPLRSALRESEAVAIIEFDPDDFRLAVGWQNFRHNQREA